LKNRKALRVYSLYYKFASFVLTYMQTYMLS